MRFFGLVLITALFGAVYVNASTHNAPEGGFVGFGYTHNVPLNVPHFSEFASQFPQCSAGSHLGDLLMVDLYRRPHIVDFDTAVKLSKTGDWWVVGKC